MAVAEILRGLKYALQIPLPGTKGWTIMNRVYYNL